MHTAAAIGFQRAAEAYERGRPDYPAAAVEWLADQVDLRPGRTVVDLAAGTGKLTRLLVQTGATVVAVEPIQAMCSALARLVPGVPVVAGTAEAIPLRAGIADAVTVAQAFHWFDGPVALAEIQRVLRPSGRLALVWNRRDLDDPVQQEVTRIIDPYRGDTPTYHGDAWRTALAAHGRLAVMTETAFLNQQILDAEALVDRVTSTSFIAALDPEELGAVVSALRHLADRHGGRVALPYRAEIQIFA